MIVADISSTIALSCRAVFFMPESIIDLWAKTDVNLSSQNSIGILGSSFFSRFIPGVIYFIDSESSPRIVVGFPTMILSTFSVATYFFTKSMRVCVGTVVSPFATICKESVTAMPQRLRP